MRERRFVAWSLGGLAAAAAVLALSACEPQPVLSIVVSTTVDGADANPGDGVCEITPARRDCSLRAAFDEANSADRRVDIKVPGKTFVLTLTSGSPAVVEPIRMSSTQSVGLHAAREATIDAGGASSALVVESGSLGMGELSVTGASSSGFHVVSGSLVVFGASSTGNGIAGIQVDAGGSARLSYVHLDDNGSYGAVSNGALELDHVSASRNTTGVEVDAGTATISDSIISGNAGGFTGGGIDVGGPYGTNDVTMLVRRTLIDHNQAETGAGIYHHQGTLTIEDSTVTANVGGGVQVGASNPSIYSEGTAHVVRSTIVGNGGASTPSLALEAGTLTVGGSVVDDAGTACAGAITSLGYNLDGTGTCGFSATGDQSGVSPLLLPLGANGGLTRSMLPAANSPLVDAIPVGTVGLCDASAPRDQRGATRPSGAACDIGAVEGAQITPIQPLYLLVDTPADGRDANPGDGFCVTAAGACSLRAAVDETNAWPASDHIILGNGIDPVLSIAGAGDDTNATGDIDITDTVDLAGNGRKIDAAGLDRGIDVIAGVRSALHDLEVTGGSTTGSGGGIRSSVAGGINPAVRLDGLWVRGNRAAIGGGIDVPGSAAIANSDITGNTATVGGGGVSGSGVLTIDGTNISGNTGGDGGGLLIPSGGGYVRVTLSYINDNAATTGNGGGIAVGVGGLTQSTGELVVDRSSVDDNTVSGGDFGQYGGGIFQNGGDVTVLLSSVSGNSTGTAVSSEGGGIAAIGGSLTVRMSTIADNETGGSGGGVWSQGAPFPSTILIFGSTVAGNTAGLGSGLAANATVTGSVVVANGGSACYGTISSGLYSFASDASCGFSATGEAMLSPLGNFGGTTRSLLPAAESPLVDAIPIGTPELCDETYQQDQRALTRLAGGGCDIGSIER